MHLFVVELGDFDAVGAGQVEDFGGPGDARQVRTVADLSPSRSNSPKNSFAQAISSCDGERPSFTTAHWSGVRQILPVIPNSTETAVASMSFNALDPMVGPSIALGRLAAFAAMVKRERA